MISGSLMVAYGDTEHYGREGILEQSCSLMAAKKQRDGWREAQDKLHPPRTHPHDLHLPTRPCLQKFPPPPNNAFKS
jgi:hypothetical protein